LSIPERFFATDGQVLHQGLSVNDKELTLGTGFRQRMDMERVASPAWGGVRIELYRAIGAVAWPAPPPAG
jgi:hypothetical protein